MKTRTFYYLMIAISLIGCTQKKSLNIEGTWKMVQRQTITGNSVSTEFPGKSEIDGIKIWSGNHFMGVTEILTDTVITDEYVVGTYKLEGNNYEENITHIPYKPWEGMTVKMLLEVRNDTLIQTYPVDEKGQPDKNWASIEKYVRIKAGDSEIQNPKHPATALNLRKASKIVGTWGVVGSATKNGWNGPDIILTEDNNKKGVWALNNVQLSDGEIKFRLNNNWTFNLGNNLNGSLVSDGNNINVKAGLYDITLDLTDQQNPKSIITKR
jgi:hypothetical protein